MSRIPLTSPELYATANGAKCEGPDQCHWCGAPCGRLLKHDDVPLGPHFPKSKQAPKYPGNSYLCLGCWLFRRRKITVHHLSRDAKGRYDWRDGQAPMNQGWWITDAGAWALRQTDATLLIALLKRPPRRFSLSFLTTVGTLNLLHQVPCNDVAELRADTPLHFAVDNVPHAYTTHELSQAPRLGSAGLMGGTRFLCGIMGIPEHVEPDPEPPPKPGRPKNKEDGRTTKTILAMSGQRVPTAA